MYESRLRDTKWGMCNFRIAYPNYAKPDTHTITILFETGVSRSKDNYEIFKTMVRMARVNNESPAVIDKLLWFVGSGKYVENEKITRQKKAFIQEVRPILDRIWHLYGKSDTWYGNMPQIPFVLINIGKIMLLDILVRELWIRIWPPIFSWLTLKFDLNFDWFESFWNPRRSRNPYRMSRISRALKVQD